MFTNRTTPAARTLPIRRARRRSFPTRSLAFAHGVDGIRANAVAPGWVRTPMSVYEMKVAAAANGSTPEAEFKALTNRIALRRVAEPQEIASCCLFLASDEASFVTGAVLA